MVKKTVCLRLLIILCLSYVFPAAGFPLKVYTENAPYANYLDERGLIKGHNADVVAEIIKRLNTNDTIELIPWARGYLMLQNKPDVVLFSTARTKSRETLFKWAGPVSVAKFILYKKKSSRIIINSLEDAKKVRLIGCYKNDVRANILEEHGFENLNKLHGSDAGIRNLRMLLSGRIDLWITSLAAFCEITKKYNIDHSLFEEAYLVDKAYLYIAFSKKTADGIVCAWQKTLDDIKEDGTYEKYFSNYPMGKSFMAFEPPGP